MAAAVHQAHWMRTTFSRGPVMAWQLRHVILGFLLLSAAWAFLGPLSSRGSGGPRDELLGQHGVPVYPKHDVLVMYIFAATDPEFLNNLNYFVQEAVANDTRCDYVFVVQGQESAEGLPQLPPHARYVFHTNTCYDWGTFGWLISTGAVDTRKYAYFIFMNCSVRGPFLPAYARGRVHWAQPFIRRLTPEVKLVGPTISCEGSPLDGDMLGKWRRNPHVQSYLVATDQVGLAILQQDGNVFACHDSRWNTIYHSELGSSAAVLSAGYNIDCLMTRYQGVDWRDTDNWGCNQRYSPQGEHYYDGITLDPLEVMFIKVKSFTLMNDISSARKAEKYQQWQERPAGNLTLLVQNVYLTEPARFKVPKILEMKARGPECFDFDYYAMHNPDIARALPGAEEQWKHFVYFGQFESRPCRFSCPMDYSRLALEA